jgi:hypothetical protein
MGRRRKLMHRKAEKRNRYLEKKNLPEKKA